MNKSRTRVLLGITLVLSLAFVPRPVLADEMAGVVSADGEIPSAGAEEQMLSDEVADNDAVVVEESIQEAEPNPVVDSGDIDNPVDFETELNTAPANAGGNEEAEDASETLNNGSQTEENSIGEETLSDDVEVQELSDEEDASTGAVLEEEVVASAETVNEEEVDGVRLLAAPRTLLGATQSTLDGVDISGHNSRINIANLDADFVIIKATEWNPDKKNYTSYTTNRTNNTYISYTAQADAALAAGKLIGFYHFVTNPSMGAGWTAQAQGFIDAVSGYLGQAILVLDWEDTSYSTVESNVSGAKQWLDYVYEHTGVCPLIYMNKNCSRSYNWSSVKNAGYELWGAQYADMKHHTGYETDPWQSSSSWGAWGSRPMIFQYSATTTVDGSGGYIDVNKFYGTRDDWVRLADGGDQWVESDGDYYFVRNGSVVASGWVVTKKTPGGENAGLQRYWLNSDGTLAMGGLVQTGSGSWSYARPEGYVVRGAYASADGLVYLADNDGRLASPGWVVSSAYGQGTQRYWVDPATRACVPGYSSAGWDHYTHPAGYVVRGTYTTAEGGLVVADNDGKLESGSGLSNGWLVSSAFGQGLQRYWVEAGRIVFDRLVQVGSSEWAYARPEGFVARGRYTNPRTGYVYLADNDGRLASPGWVVSSAYGQGTQRYWVDASAHACVPGYSTDGWNHYTLATGYVLRGAVRDGDVLRIANNDGLMSNGWVITSTFGQGLQRYWQENGSIAMGGLVQTGSGSWSYARPEGYVVRGAYASADGLVYLADNDGRLASPGWVVSSAFGQGTQRYWVDAAARACVPGYSSAGWAHYTLPAGYVARNTTIFMRKVSKASSGLTYEVALYRADNNGVLTKTS